MAFTQYSQVVKPAEYVDPISKDLLLKGAMYQEANIEQGMKDLYETKSLLENLPSLPGEDTRVKNEILSGVMNQASQITTSDLRDPNVAYQFKNYVSNVTKNPDMLGIVERATKYKTELENKKAAESKGQRYFSYAIDQANNYLTQGKYIRDTRFTGEGFIAPEIQKLTGEALKNVPKVKKQEYKNGRWFTYETYDNDYLQSSLQEVYSRPDVQKLFDYEFNQKYKDYNWTDEGTKKVNMYKQNYTDILTKANLILKTDPKNQSALQAKMNAENEIKDLDVILQNPGTYGENLKNKTKAIEINDRINNDIKSAQFISEEDVKADQIAMKNIELNNNLIEKQYASLLDGANALGLTQNQLLTIMQSGFIKVKDQILDLGTIQKVGLDFKAKEAYEKASQASQARAVVKMSNMAKLGNPNIKSTETITIGNLSYQKGQWDAVSEKIKNKNPKFTTTDKDVILAVVKEYPEQFGLSGVDPTTFQKVEVDNNGKITVVMPWGSSNIEAGTLANFNSAVNNAYLNTNNPTSSTSTENASGFFSNISGQINPDKFLMDKLKDQFSENEVKTAIDYLSKHNKEINESTVKSIIDIYKKNKASK